MQRVLNERLEEEEERYMRTGKGDEVKKGKLHVYCALCVCVCLYQPRWYFAYLVDGLLARLHLDICAPLFHFIHVHGSVLARGRVRLGGLTVTRCTRIY